MRPKFPGRRAAPIPHVARAGSLFWLGLAIFMLVLLVMLWWLASRSNNQFPGFVVASWLILPIGIPALLSFQDWRKYRHGLELERDHVVLTGTVIGLYHEDTALGDLASSPVYWVVFVLPSADPTDPIEQAVSPHAYQSLRKGDRIQVKVLPRDQRICRAELH